MNRKGTTAFITNILLKDKGIPGVHMASEVVFDWGAAHPKRVDVMEFNPKGATYASEIEKGIFTCYEVKSCPEDIYSGSGMNFFGEENYLVTTMECWRKVGLNLGIEDIRKYVMDKFPESSTQFGVMIVCPVNRTLEEEFDLPTPLPLDGNTHGWTAKVLIPSLNRRGRKRGMSEMLFCMLRAASRA